jgi:hypothetical protein
VIRIERLNVPPVQTELSEGGSMLPISEVLSCVREAYMGTVYGLASGDARTRDANSSTTALRLSRCRSGLSSTPSDAPTATVLGGRRLAGRQSSATKLLASPLRLVSSPSRSL